MRKKIALAFVALSAAGVLATAAPAGAAKEAPVEVRKECGGYNVYINGTPLITYVWCPENPPA